MTYLISKYQYKNNLAKVVNKTAVVLFILYSLLMANSQTQKPNHLIDEKSPYLLQHAYNPIEWYPWGEEAFAKARAENKPILLSIGYSTCHWCHVMEEESYSDDEVAAVLNDAFVAIKVDREERPDIDAIYMNVAILMNGRGGWPLNIIMTPEQKPFFAATYIPKEDRFGNMGLISLAKQVKGLWQNEPERILEFSDNLLNSLQNQQQGSAGQSIGAAVLDTAYNNLSSRFDPEFGGFADSVKFPSPHNLLFLLRYYHRNGDAQALNMVEITLQAMRNGGIYDHLGYGFHRYSTDQKWLIPHFEKMLYDQAMLAIAYTEAYQITKKPIYKQTAEEIFSYVLRDMHDVLGGFYSAEDADSEGEEGTFYLWTLKELSEILSNDDVGFLIDNFDLSQDGNFFEAPSTELTGKTILHPSKDLNAAELKKWQGIQRLLFEHREARIHPYKDNKVLTDWNGLMIVALAKAARAFSNQSYQKEATKTADFILEYLKDSDGNLLHRYREGESGIQATLDDYAFLIWGLQELYEANFEVKYLKEAKELSDTMLESFWDSEYGGLFLTANNAEELLLRPKEIYDGAIPSGNSVATLALLRLARSLGIVDYEIKAAELSGAFSSQVLANPAGHTFLLSALDFVFDNSYELVISGDYNDAATQNMIELVRAEYLPNKVVLFRPLGKEPEIVNLATYTRYQYQIEDKATAYVCENQVCNQPTNDAGLMLELLQNKN